MIFLIDAQLPPALSHWLTQQGHTAQHVEDLGLREADDIEIWNHAFSTAQSLLQRTKTLLSVRRERQEVR